MTSERPSREEQLRPLYTEAELDRLSPENYVADFLAQGEKSNWGLASWEQPYSDVGAIERADRLGYINLNQNTGYTVSLTNHGRWIAEVLVKGKATRRALFMCASHCQGGHSAAGDAAASVLGISFPITQAELEAKAVAEGFDPKELWPGRGYQDWMRNGRPAKL